MYFIEMRNVNQDVIEEEDLHVAALLLKEINKELLIFLERTIWLIVMVSVLQKMLYIMSQLINVNEATTILNT
jgi:hypothetical protein